PDESRGEKNFRAGASMKSAARIIKTETTALPKALFQKSALNRTWIIFLIFVLTNSLLSYSSLGLQTKLWIGFLGLLLPFLAALTAPPARDSTPLHSREFLPPVPRWIWVLIGVTALGVRFYRLTTLSAWPTPDDGVNCSFSLGLNEGLYRKFFLSDAQVPVGSFWVLSLFYHLFPPSLFS